MSTESFKLTVSGIEADVQRKDIKNLHISIMPPDGRVRVSAPQSMSDDAIRLSIVSRITRIRKERKSFSEYVRESRKEMVSGESHFVNGKRYLLELVDANETPSVSLKSNSVLVMKVRPGSSLEKREEVMREWLRRRMKESMEEMIPVWEQRMGLKADFYGIRRMRTKWGSCNSRDRRIWLNLELAKKPPKCLEYVLVHELTHILEPTHNQRFFQLMDGFMPNWRLHKEELDKPPLVHMDWDY